MSLSKQHKIWGTAIGLAVIGLAVDRFVFPHKRGDDTTAAAAMPEQLLIRNESTPPAIAPAAITDEGGSLTYLLGGIFVYKRLNIDMIPDAFAVPPAWTQDAVPLKPVAIVPDWHKQFITSHRLTGVFMAGRRSQALVDGKAIFIGQAIDGFKLIAVTRASATFVREGTTALLTLDAKPAAPSPSSAARMDRETEPLSVLRSQPREP